MSSTQGAGPPSDADADLEALSAWIDGELEPGQQQQVLERIRNDQQLRVHLEWLHVAGDALRSHEVAACHSPELSAKVIRALQSEPDPRVPTRGSGHGVRWYLAAGLSVAAAAATVMLFALPQLRATEGLTSAPGPVAGAGAAPAAQPAVPAGSALLASGATTAQPMRAKSAAPVASRALPMDAYFRAHRELATTGVMPSSVAYIRFSAEPDQ